MPPVQTDRVIDGMGEGAVEALLAFRDSGLELFWSSWSAVLGVDAVGGPPHGDISDEADVQVRARRRPHELGTVMAGSLTSNLIGKTGDQLGPLRQVVTPDGMVADRLGDCGEPR